MTDDPIEPLEDKLDTITDTIDHTPLEDRDEKWRQNLTSTLGTIQAEITELKESKGANPELLAMQQQISELVMELRALKTTHQVSPPPPLREEVDKPTLETPKEGLSGQTEQSEQNLAPARKRNHRWT
jgi:FtsZ-binding cell division protein ZapB